MAQKKTRGAYATINFNALVRMLKKLVAKGIIPSTTAGLIIYDAGKYVLRGDGKKCTAHEQSLFDDDTPPLVYYPDPKSAPF